VVTVGPSHPVAGRVVDWETGKPIAGAVVRAFLVHGHRLTTSREREHFATTTDAQGRYQITGLPIGENNRLVAFTTGEAAYLPVAHQVDTLTPPGESDSQDFRLRQVYATILDQWLDVPSKSILGSRFPKINLLDS
jgi:hypothetical protein